MKKNLGPSTAWIVLAWLMTGGNALAQSLDPGDIGIYMDPAGHEGVGQIQDFVPFDVYVVAFDVPGGVQGFEYGVLAPPLLPREVRRRRSGWIATTS